MKEHVRKQGWQKKKIREIRKVFDADYKRLKRQNKAMEREGLDFFSLECLMDPRNGANYFDFIDPDFDVENIIIHKLDLERLNKILGMLSSKNREFILDCFDSDHGDRNWISEKYGMTLGAIKHKKGRLIEKIRKLFFEEY